MGFRSQGMHKVRNDFNEDVLFPASRFAREILVGVLDISCPCFQGWERGLRDIKHFLVVNRLIFRYPSNNCIQE